MASCRHEFPSPQHPLSEVYRKGKIRLCLDPHALKSHFFTVTSIGLKQYKVNTLQWTLCWLVQESEYPITASISIRNMGFHASILVAREQIKENILSVQARMY